MNIDVDEFFKLPFDKRENIYFQYFPEAKKLKKKLLAHGGNKVVWMPDDGRAC